MIALLRILFAIFVLAFYLPILSGVWFALNDVAPMPLEETGHLWKQVGTWLGSMLGLSVQDTSQVMAVWAIVALLSVIGHTIFSIVRARRGT